MEVSTRLAAEVLGSRRYRWIAPDLVQRLAGDALVGARNEADAVKRTKRRLHQIFGAYVWDVRPDVALTQLRTALETGGAEGVRTACRALLGRHASTRERLPVLDELYRAIFALTGPPAVLMDLACGLGPLALPWMGLPPGTKYLACDIDRRLVHLVDGFLTLLDVPHVATLRDVVATPPPGPADVALLLKTAPCLEQQAPGSTRRLVCALEARHVVLTFPTRSLGGACKGMSAHYRALLDEIVAGMEWQIQELRFPPELVFVLTKPPSAAPSPSDVRGVRLKT